MTFYVDLGFEDPAGGGTLTSLCLSPVTQSCFTPPRSDLNHLDSQLSQCSKVERALAFREPILNRAISPGFFVLALFAR